MAAATKSHRCLNSCFVRFYTFLEKIRRSFTTRWWILNDKQQAAFRIHPWTMSAAGLGGKPAGERRKSLNVLSSSNAIFFWNIVQICQATLYFRWISMILSQSLTSVYGACGLNQRRIHAINVAGIFIPIFILHHKCIQAINVTKIFEREFSKARVGRVD